jgi:hypothetical protein
LHQISNESLGHKSTRTIHLPIPSGHGGSIAGGTDPIRSSVIERFQIDQAPPLETAILASSAKKTKGAEKRASTIANMLCACGLTWKHSLSSQQEFLEKMRDATRLCCRELAGD